MTVPSDPRTRFLLTRRAFLGVSVGTLATIALASCAPAASWVQPDGAPVREAERRRGGTGKVTTATLTAAPSALDLAGTTAATWAFGSIPAPVIRLGAGDTLKATVRNQLDTDTSVHWHGLALRNDMDGVPPVTQQPIRPDESFDYEFIASDPGTYWFHPHVGVQLDRGLYGALIVEDPAEAGDYDDEWVIILDDWLDGVTATPDEVLAELSRGMGTMTGDMFMRMGNTLMGATSDLLGGDAGDVYYPTYLINGKPAGDPAQFTASPGQRIRLRIINAGSDTAFRVVVGGHTLTITHTDGFPVTPTEVDSILIGMGERYDAVITFADGVFPLIAQAEGKRDRGFALVRTGDGSVPAVDVSVPELDSDRAGTADLLRAAGEVTLPTRGPDRQISIALTGSMAAYDWGVDGRRFDMRDPLRGAHEIRQGERVRLTIDNQTTMWHPFHLHGHTYQHQDGGPRKDTSIILPKQTLTVDFDADNPGLWVAHCHNIYHAETGMTTVIGYRA
ncbi:multicopper oxidase family protein [Microbacterium sp. S16(2024)]|uniref:multicopper oxidase family protein n=1 Tax=Microbacterium sp. S16(2024) TaxID=3368601 RepID=UPI0010FE6E0C|nr:multicopper oxidase family protein [Microbacterium sp. 5K110]TLF29720.1 multicopper oxidase family protein [Microbacterium sp. 5K110]